MNVKISKVKIVTFTPCDYTDIIRDAACNIGAGVIGNYCFCTSCTKSVGTFIPSSNSNPYIGEKGKLEIVDEDRLEIICDIKLAKKIVNEIRSVHPYEEPAIDIIPMIDENSLM